jgi:bidirectional [NiFe] hydrogenase diaphorase subunit
MTTHIQVKTLVIDGRAVSARATSTLLEAAQEEGIFVPTMCHLEGLSEIGACRLCLVEVKGINKLLPACVTRVEEGMEVTTHSERLDGYRRTILEFLFAEGNHICSVCVANGHCELQSMAQRLGMDHVRVPYISPRRQIDASHQRFTFDANRCILCTRCVRVCDEIEGAHTWDMMGRGVDSRIISDLNEPWGESTSCTSCGKCVQVCPTGALVEKGKSVAESVKHPDFLPYLKRNRGQQ